jgi:hypothetical protein
MKSVASLRLTLLFYGGKYDVDQYGDFRSISFGFSSVDLDNLYFDSVIKVIGRTVPRNNFLRYLFYILYFAAICFGHCWPSSGGVHNYFREVTSLQRSVVLCYKSYFVYRLANTAVVYLICEHVKMIWNTLL